MFLILFIQHQTRTACGTEAHAASEVLQLTRSCIRGHDDHRISEIHKASVTICQTSLVEYLQQEVEHITMCLLYLVEQHNRVGVTAHALCQLSTFLIAHITRRRTD